MPVRLPSKSVSTACVAESHPDGYDNDITLIREKKMSVLRARFAFNFVKGLRFRMSRHVRVVGSSHNTSLTEVSPLSLVAQSGSDINIGLRNTEPL